MELSNSLLHNTEVEADWRIESYLIRIHFQIALSASNECNNKRKNGTWNMYSTSAQYI